MKTRVLQFDVFTSQIGKGNPAGIVLMPDHLDADAMQAIATVTGCNDTAFVLPSRAADFSIRYFSPRREVELCGHATIAAATALLAAGLVEKSAECGFTLETKVGILPIRIQPAEQQPLVIMSQSPSQFRPFSGSRSALTKALSISEDDLHSTLSIMYGSTGRWTLVVPLRSLEAIQRMKPNTDMFPEVLVGMANASLHPFCLDTLGHGVHLHARHFSAPSSGTIEDPVTGTASGVLGAYYREFIANQQPVSAPIIVEQGYEVGREGRVLVWAEKSGDSYDVRIGGSAIFAGELLVNFKS